MSDAAGNGVGPSVCARGGSLEEGWESVEVADILEPWLSRMNDLGFDVEASDVVSVIVASGEVDRALRLVETDVGWLQETCTDSCEEALRQFVPHTRVFFHRPKAVDLGWDAATAAGVFVTTGSGSLASALTILRRTIQTFKHLSPEEMDVVLVMRGICGTRDRHRTTVSAGELAAVYRDSPVSAEALEALVTSLLKKGVVTEVDGGWRLVP